MFRFFARYCVCLSIVSITHRPMRIEHIGIAVRDLAAANNLYEQLLGAASYKQEAVESEHVMTSFFQTGESKVELLAATSPDSAIAKYIEKRGKASTTSPSAWTTSTQKWRAYGQRVSNCSTMPPNAVPTACGSASYTPKPPTAYWWNCANPCDAQRSAVGNSKFIWAHPLRVAPLRASPTPPATLPPLAGDSIWLGAGAPLPAVAPFRQLARVK